jgi:hypothetical protein
MLRAAYRLAVLSVLVAAGSLGYWYFHNPQSPAVRIQKLEEEKRELEQVVRRLTDERRVAEMIVTDQRRDEKSGNAETTLLFVEQARDGSPLPARSFTVKGDEVWVAGLSIRFAQDFVMKNDPLRGRGIMLFTKIFGQNQTPAEGLPIDDPGRIPDVYRGDPKEVARVSEFERDLWANFWRLVDDKRFRAEKGVETAGGKAAYAKVSPDRLYRITLDTSGNPTMDWEPIKPIYREAMKKSSSATTNVQ